MEALFTFEALGVLGTLVFLQAVLGFDNLLYISIESQRAPEKSRAFVRKAGIAIAVILRLVLLFVIIGLLERFAEPLIQYGIPYPAGAHGAAGEQAHDASLGWFGGNFNLKAIIFLFGGAFIMYTAVKEISHLLSIDDLHHDNTKGSKSTFLVIGLIVFMNLVFSFDSILSMLPLTSQFESDSLISPQFVLMAIAVVISGIAMIVLADRVADFIQRNRMFEVLGLFILLIVGVMLLGEGGHIAHMHFFGYPIEAMSKSTFYFSVGVLFIVDIVQTRYQRKLDVKRRAQSAHIERAADKPHV